MRYIDSNTTATADIAEGLTPSAKFVRHVLTHHGDHTQSELAEATGLSTRTVRDAVGSLVERDVVTEEVCIRDARKRVYSVPNRDRT